MEWLYRLIHLPIHYFPILVPASAYPEHLKFKVKAVGVTATFEDDDWHLDEASTSESTWEKL